MAAATGVAPDTAREAVRSAGARWLRSAARFAWALLVHDKMRLLTSTGGVAFALLLMILQLGFRNALLDSSLELLEVMDADIVVTHVEKTPFLRRITMPRQRLFQALSVDGVSAGYPVWMTLLYWKNFRDGTERPIRVVAFQPDDPVFRLDDVLAASELLKTPGNVLVDRRSRDSYGDMGLGPAQIQRREVEVVGSFSLGTDFEADGTVIMSEATYFDLSRRSQQQIEMALVKVEPGTPLAPVVEAMRRSLPRDVAVQTKAEILARDLAYWERRTPISVILLVGVGLGFCVGIVTCYQILYTEVLDHMAEFATLKAMGFGNRYLRSVVLGEAWLLALVGFVPAVVIGAGMIELLGHFTGLPAGLTLEASASVLLLSLGMCSAAAAFALRRVTQVDPAELF